jgi:transposase
MGSSCPDRAQLRATELQSGMPAQHGSRKGSAAAYSLKSVRDQERDVAEQAQRTYQRLFSRWKQACPKGHEAPPSWREYGLHKEIA